VLPLARRLPCLHIDVKAIKTPQMRGNHYEISDFSNFIRPEESTGNNFKQLKEGIAAI
jgi:hypothetical protein